MKIALVVAQFPVASEGFIVDKVLALLRAGVDVHVAADRVDDDGLAQVRSRSGVDLGSIAHAAPAGAGSRASAAAVVARTPRAAAHAWRRLPGPSRARRVAHDLPLLKLAPDLVHTEFATLAVRRTHLPEVLRCPLTTSVRGYDVAYAGLDQPGFYDRVWPALSGVHVLGADLWARARRRGCPAGLFHATIPPALNVEDFDQADVTGEIDAHNPLRLLSIGRLHWKKAHHHSLVALRAVLDSGVPARLRIVGDGPDLESVAFTRHQLGLDEHVELVGRATRPEVRAELAVAQLFIHSAVTEGFSNAVLEAQAAGLPVVCADAEGLAENIEPGRTGILVPRRDPEAMASAVIELAGDPKRRRRMGAAGRERASARDLDQQAAAFVEFFDHAITDFAGAQIR